MNAGAHLAALVNAIRQDLEECGALEGDLSHQQRLLAAQDADGLEQVGNIILGRVTRLQLSSRERATRLTDLGMPKGPGGINALASRLPNRYRQSLLSDWQRLETALARCQVINERNGELLATNRSVVEQLTGQAVSPYDDGLR